MIYDVATCVGEKHIDVAIKSIRSLLLFSDARKIFAISSARILDQIEKEVGQEPRIRLLDENHLINTIDINFIKEKFKQRIGSEERTNWYFQQFIKMSISGHPEISEYYLIWDSDTILLKPTAFFDESNRVLINPANEYHRPYFDSIERILNIKRQVSFSFISEHFMVKKEYMQILIQNISANAQPNTSWIEHIISSIDNKDLGKSGFSEYETYGNFIALKFRNSFSLRKIKSTRYGTIFFGSKPDKYAIFSLMRSGYAFATFESWHKISRLKAPIMNSIARVAYIFCYLTRRYSEQLKAANEIVRLARDSIVVRRARVKHKPHRLRNPGPT